MIGDKFHFNFTEKWKSSDNVTHSNSRLLHSEVITEEKEYSCYVVLRTPVGIGMIMGTNLNEVKAWLEETWPGGQCTDDEAIL
jgi:hypothetical protein